MKIITEKRCIIGESPVWNENEKLLYITNGMEKEICIIDVKTGELKVRPTDKGVCAIAFTENDKVIVSSYDGVFILNNDNTATELYDTDKYKIQYANDMKVGPDGAIYVGTMSLKRKGISEEIDGKLYRIDKNGNVNILLDNLILSNGLEWSVNEKYFYHTDSDTNTIKEYNFDKLSGNISYTGRSIKIIGIDGFTIDENNNLFVACWGQGHIAIVDTKEMKIKDYIKIPAKIPASCSFCGENMDTLAIATANYNCDLSVDKNAGYPILLKTQTKGRKPYLFG